MKFAIALLLLAGNAFGSTTYFVRTDGGTPAQCSGLVNAPYSGNVINRGCAVSNLMYLLPPNIDGGDTNNRPVFTGGDTVQIAAGQYPVGEPFGTGLWDSCKVSNTWDCMMQPIPSGTAANPTKIIGAGSTLTQLFGQGGTSAVINMTGSNYVVLQGLEITDHSACIKDQPDKTVGCPDSSVIAPWASNGIQNTNGKPSKSPGIPSTGVTMTDLWIHGLAKYGLLYGNFSNITVSNVKIIGNGRGGWSTDLDPAYSVSSGTNTFTNIEIGWSGCTENYPSATIWGCWGQETGGYGDGFGTSGQSDQGTWVFRSSYIHDNTQDGLDFLHASNLATITFDQINARNNAGNQLKTNGTATISNSVIVGGCASMQGKYDMHGSPGGDKSGDMCRALGDTIQMGQAPGQTTTVDHNTIISQGNTFITVPDTGPGDKTSKLNITNNIMVGLPRWVKNDGHLVDIWWWGDGTPVNTPTWTENVFFNTDVGTCPIGNSCVDPKLVDERLATFDATPTASTPPNVGAIQSTTIPPPPPANPPTVCNGGTAANGICTCPSGKQYNAGTCVAIPAPCKPTSTCTSAGAVSTCTAACVQ